MAKIYDFKALTSKGKEIDFSQFEGKVLLIVNKPEVQRQRSGNHRLPMQPV